MTRAALLTVTLLALACGPEPKDTGSIPGPGPGPADASPRPSSTIGGACSCDSDCPSDGGNAGICVYGICMTQARGECSGAGSTTECGEGSRCWSLEGEVGSICWPDCASYDCDGVCDPDGSCIPGEGDNCDLACGVLCSCESNDDCDDGEACIQGRCIAGSGEGPGQNPGKVCSDLPPRECVGSAEYCSELISFDPRTTAFYDDYPINGETAGNQYRSYLSRDLVMLLQYTTARVLCETSDWAVGNGGALGLGDMSEENGAIPGVSVGQQGHPDGTHVNGRDIDIGYYQIGTSDNRLRPICEHEIDGADQYHCVGDPLLIDVWRHALFLGYVFDSPLTRVIGVDGKAGPVLAAAINELCATGWLSSGACDKAAARLAYETTNTNLGWYQFHHHHSHISTCKGGCASALEGPPATLSCRTPGCGEVRVKPHPHRRGLRF